jgi:hypothetical protein
MQYLQWLMQLAALVEQYGAARAAGATAQQANVGTAAAVLNSILAHADNHPAAPSVTVVTPGTFTSTAQQ